jgi:acetylornithine deacetylase
MKKIINEVIELLKSLIATPSFSREEEKTADLINAFLEEKKILTYRKKKNVWAKNKHFSSKKPTLLLVSHHDTVKPVVGWQRNPFLPSVENGRLYGLGSNDAGASLVAMLAAFLQFYEANDLAFNLIYAAVAEEEISGKDGITSILSDLENVTMAIVGEPTQLQPAVAERGLVVIDAVAKGKAGHAARQEGINALYIALEDIQKIQHFSFEKKSNWLPDVSATVTQIEAGIQHNVVPDTCHFVIDVRPNDQYSNEEVVQLLQQQCQSTLTARSLRLQSSTIDPAHPFVKACLALGLQPFGSPTLSDMALLPFPAIKLGCGDSARSHTADEYIELNEIAEGVAIYTLLISELGFQIADYTDNDLSA